MPNANTSAARHLDLETLDDWVSFTVGSSYDECRVQLNHDSGTVESGTTIVMEQSIDGELWFPMDTATEWDDTDFGSAPVSSPSQVMSLIIPLVAISKIRFRVSADQSGNAGEILVWCGFHGSSLEEIATSAS